MILTLVFIAVHFNSMALSEFFSSHYELSPCGDPKKFLLPPSADSQTSVPTLSVIACAIYILGETNLPIAVFHPNIIECQHKAILKGKSFEEITRENTGDDTCTVISKSDDDNKTTFADWQLVEPVSLQQMANAQFIPLKIFTTSGSDLKYVPATYTLLDSVSYFSASHEQFGIAADSASFLIPLHYMFRVFMKDEDDKETFAAFSVYGHGKYIPRNMKGRGNFDIKVRNDFNTKGKNARFVVTNSTEWMIMALLQGYRRVQRGPYLSRAFIDVKNMDVHFDTTETYVVHNDTDMREPIYFTSIKESVRSGKRYEFYHQVNNGTNSLPSLETEPESSWVMENSWARLEPVNSTQTLVQAVKENILKGREIRLVMGKEISADVISTQITPNDVIVTLQMYLTPFVWTDSKDATTQLVRFPVLGLQSKTLIECEMEYMTDNLTNVHTTKHTSTLDLYVSTRNWIKVLHTTPNGMIISGSPQHLYEKAGEGGKNVRVCVTEFGGKTLCHRTIRVFAGRERTVLQTGSILKVALDGDALQGVHGNCERSYRVIDSSGKIESVDFVAGTKTQTKSRVLYQSQSWFVEQ